RRARTPVVPKSKTRSPAPKAPSPSQTSESELRSEADFQVVECSIIEENFVSRFQPQTDRSPEALKAGTRIYGQVRATIADAGNGVANRAGGYRGICSREVNKSNLTRHEKFERAGGLELRTEQSGQRAHPGGHKLGADTIVEGTGEVAFEVIVHLGFDLREMTHIETGASAKSHKGGGVRRCRAKAEVVGEDSHLTVVIVSPSLLRCKPGWRSNQHTQMA